MSELFVGDFRIDINRSEVIYQENISTLEPKVLKVLLLLAEKPGEIIPKQKLLDEVWPNVIVEANTLQRCIAQLRKAFNDDAKTQAFITTHPRRGYSLVAKVSWEKNKEFTALHQAVIQTTVTKATQLKSKRIYVMAALLMSVILLGTSFWFWGEQTSNNLNVKQITPLTSTDATEYRASFSPNGKFVAFQRYVDAQTSHIWAKSLHDNSEYQLTRESDIYGKPEWSPDGTHIAFHRSSVEESNSNSIACYAITSLSFALAKSSSQSVRQLIGCENEQITSLTWLTNNTIAYTLGIERNNPVIEVDIKKKTSHILYQNKNKTNHEVTFSKRNNKLAFLQVENSRITNVLTLNKITGVAEEIIINFPKGYDDRHWSGLNWHPNEDRFLISNNQSLMEITTGGEIVEYPMMTYQRIYDPVYHPSGKSVAATLGLADFDIAELTWSDDNQNNSSNASSDEKLFRSTVGEGGAKYRPQTSNNYREVVFASNRSGYYQLWFDDGKKLKQLSHFTKGQQVGSSVWSLDGNLLAVNIDQQLQLFNINGEVEQVEKTLDVVSIYQWVGDHQLLMRIIKNKQSQIILFDVNSGKSTELFKGTATWAQLDSQQRLYLSNNKGIISEIINGKQRIIDEMNEYNAHKKFLIKAERIFFNDGHGGFWQFDLKSKKMLLLAKRSARALRLDDVDVDNKRLLYLNYVQGRKEIVLFH